MRRLAAHLTYANVMSTFAAFIALGGVSYAAVTLPRNSVGSTQLKKNAVTSAKIKDGTIQRADLAGGVVGSGPAGPAGATGSAGADGKAGADGRAGAAGETGASGLAGPAGPAGTQGVAGPAGAQGVAGAAGTDGVAGPTGATGPAGPSTGPAGGALTGTFPNPTLANGSVGIGALQTGAVTTGKLGDASVTTAKLGDASVTAAKIVDGAVTSAKVGLNALGGDDINESSLVGVAQGSFDTQAFDVAQGSTAIVTVATTTAAGRLAMACSGTSNVTSVTWSWTRSSSLAVNNFQDVAGAYAPTVAGDEVVEGQRLTTSTPTMSFTQAASGSADVARRFSLDVLGATGDSLRVSAHAITRDGASTGCRARISTELQSQTFTAVP